MLVGFAALSPDRLDAKRRTRSLMTKVRLCFHDRCFDGTASAALFYRFYRERFDQAAEFGCTGMTHRAAQPWEAGLFDGDENVIVDFKFSNSPKVTWWFDHHQSAFLTPADAEQFRKQPGPHMFYQPDYKSCTKLIATIAREKFGFDTKPLADLIHWGDIIDGAQYATPQLAVELAEPATQLALVIEAAPENGLPARIIPELAYRPLSEMVNLPLVAKHLGPLLERHRRSIEILRQRIGGARENFTGHEPVEPGNRESKPGFTCGEIWRRRPSACLCYFVRTRRGAPGACSCAGAGCRFARK